MKTIAIIGGTALVIGLWVMGSYNGLVSQDQMASTAWSQVETQYQRRFDLIPNLVSATKGAMKQEQKIFGEIAEARTRYASSAPNTKERVEAMGQYESVIGRLLVIMENYPQLKSLDNVRALTDELAGTENRVLVARDRYNDQVRIWNTMTKRFPRNVIAGAFGFGAREFFQADTGAKEAPEVNLEIQ